MTRYSRGIYQFYESTSLKTSKHSRGEVRIGSLGRDGSKYNKLNAFLGGCADKIIDYIVIKNKRTR